MLRPERHTLEEGRGKARDVKNHIRACCYVMQWYREREGDRERRGEDLPPGCVLLFELQSQTIQQYKNPIHSFRYLYSEVF